MADTLSPDEAEKRIRARWLKIVGWVSAPGKATGKRYTHQDFPQLVVRRDFWGPWAKAWEQGNKNITAITAQIANLMGAEEEARAINEKMIPPKIPVPDSPQDIAWDMVEASPALKAAEVIDDAAPGPSNPDELAKYLKWGGYAAGAVAGLWALSTIARVVGR